MSERPSEAASPYSVAPRSADERDPLIQRGYDDPEAVGTTAGEPLNGDVVKPLAGGTILGIHNLAIVMPQFIVCINLDSLVRTCPTSRVPQIAVVASLIFRIVDESTPSKPLPSHEDISTLVSGGLGDHTTYFGKNGVAWVLRFGGLCTLLGTMFAKMVPPTKAEQQTQAALRTLKALKAEEEEG